MKKVKINNILECLSDCKKKNSYVKCLMKLFSLKIFLGELTIKHLQIIEIIFQYYIVII